MGETSNQPETGGARELATLNRLYAEHVAGRAAEQARHAREVADLDARVSVLLTNYLEALTGQATIMASSAVVGLITPMLKEIQKMHGELLAMQTDLKEQYALLMKTRADGNNTRMITNYNTQRVDELEEREKGETTP